MLQQIAPVVRQHTRNERNFLREKQMSQRGLLFCTSVLCLILAACGQHGATTSANAAAPAKPAATADENTWGNYLAEQGKLHGKDVGMRPYIYVIPVGESIAANARRQNEAESIVQSIGPILMPGGMLIIGGPDAKQTTAFISDVSKRLKENALKDIAVMVVTNATEHEATSSALKQSGAAVRFVDM